MIDWGKLGPTSPPQSTTAPVAPATPGALPTLPTIPTIQPATSPAVDKFGRPTGIIGDASLSPEEAAMTREEVDALGPVGQFSRGIDMLGDFLFGEKSALNNTIFEDLAGAGGSILGGVGDLAVVKPLEIGAGALHSVPLGWLPGGADETFGQIGNWAKANDPILYAEWQKIDAAAQGNWWGGDLRADFNVEALTYLDDQRKDSLLGKNPTLAIGRAGVGSLGDAFGDAVGGWLGFLSNESQGALGNAGVFNWVNDGVWNRPFEEIAADARSGNSESLSALSEEAKTIIARLDSGEYTEAQARAAMDTLRDSDMSRVESLSARAALDLPLTAVEQQAVDAYTSGAWSKEHANDWLISHGAGISGNPYAQLVGSVLTDPLTIASVGAGSIAKAGTVGARLTEAGAAATNAYERAALAVRSVQTSQLGPAFRIARGFIDPLAVYKPSSVQTAVTDLRNGVALEAAGRAYGWFTMSDLRAMAREFGMTYEVDSALASYSIDQANLMIARHVQQRLLDENFGLDLVKTNVDDVIDPIAERAGRDAVTELTDHMLERAKNTFTEEEAASLSGRLAATFGNDVPYWAKRMEGMSDDLKSLLHAVTYKRAEVEFEQARALIDQSAYTGDLPIRNMVLMTSDTLDNIVAQDIIDNIRAVLKAEADELEGKIAAATAEWNAQARRYPSLATIGYAPGGKEQLERLVKELEKKLAAGGITRRAMPEELGDATLRPVRDMLDRNSLPPEPGAVVEEAAEALPAKVTTYYDRHTRNYVSYLEDAEGNQIGDAMYDGTKADRAVSVAQLQATMDNAIAKATLAAEEAARGKSLWRVGFRPDEEVAWGLKEDVNTGRYIVDRDPTISHVVDAVPGRQPFSDTTRNVLGQIVGKSNAERLNKPIDSIEAMTNTLRDVITGRRLVLNIERRFEKTTFEAGIPKPLAKEIITKAREVAGLDYSTIRGVRPDNLWNAISDMIPRGLVLKDGTHLNVHVVMDHLLQAAEGDLRIMGLTSKFSQRARNAIRRSGLDPANWVGQMTVTWYNKVRYSQPTFLIQRITDAPYYSILYGVTPVGKGALKGAKAELAKITENIGHTGMARDFSMDMPEYATRSNFTAGIKSSMQQAGLKEARLQRILEAPDTIIANNMTNMLYSRLGDIVKGTLDNLATAAKQADPSMQADMLAQGEVLQRSFADWRRVYSEQAGRVLDDNEVGLRYIQDQLNGWRRHVVKEDGTLDLQRLIHEGERAMPGNIADIGPIRPDSLAQELGYADGAALRRDITDQLVKVKGELVPIKGEHDLAWLEEQLRVNLRAHPDYTRRVLAYFGETWDEFWGRLQRGVDEGGLDISPHYAKEAKYLIAMLARDRGMDPWEYLSGVMASNVGAMDIETHIGQLMAFLKSGKAKQPLEEWTKMFRATLDPSAQETLLREFEAAVDVDAVVNTLKPAPWGVRKIKSAPGKPDREAGDLPKNFTLDAGYVHRIDVLDKMRGGWRKGEGVTLGAPDVTYIDGRPGLGVFRAKAADGADLKPFTLKGQTMTNGNYRQTKRAIPPENIEMLTESGWVPLGEDPMAKIMAKDFPEAVRQRIISGVPHPDPEIESYMQALSKWVNDALGSELGARTRADLRRLVEAVPTNHASHFNRTQALIVNLLKDKIEDSQRDIFRLAEMQTQRSVLERSLNHPLFGLYPASYMWGKVLPESVKFFARNPYAATYAIADVQRSIAIQREYDPEMEDKMNAVDRSAAAFLLDYMTPGLPWNAHEARMSPMARKLLEGAPEEIWTAELATVSPERWISAITEFGKESLEFVQQLGEEEAAPTSFPGLQDIVGTPSAGGEPGDIPQITGPVKASGLADILSDDLSRLQSILLEGASPEE